MSVSLSVVSLFTLLSWRLISACRESPPTRVTDICKNCTDLPEHLLECEDVYDFLDKNESINFKTENGLSKVTARENLVLCFSYDNRF